MALQVDSDTKLAIEQQYSSDVQVILEKENAKRQQQVISDSLEKQQSEIVHLQRERDEQNRVVKDMEETIAALEVERLTQSSASDGLQNLQAAKNELQTISREGNFTAFNGPLELRQARATKKSQVEKELQARVKELEAIVSDYQFKLQVSESGADTEDEAQVKELEALVKQLQDRLRVSENTTVRRKKDHAREKELEEQVKLLERKLSAKGREQQQQIEELEASVEQYRLELHISEPSIEAKELSAMHEKVTSRTQSHFAKMQLPAMHSSFHDLQSYMKVSELLLRLQSFPRTELASTFGRKKTNSVGALLAGFFDYYAHRFNLEEKVVSVRIGSALSKTTKWSRPVSLKPSIEDTFELAHDVGRVVFHRKGQDFIRS
ncbi:hypothetical protein PsorP6_017187 [Peronosclerospora sorghi]|uniref:Uncharacterized protein n=1 Tax=Peronosclerospora sorghi TaxID=230839 RepID=A0ACC0WFL9_9STRA|nr:hypothetical protein PsorP6_017187 [Peronosclerospora sorghi]